MKNLNAIRVISVSGAILGAVAALIGNWSQQQLMDKTIEEKVNEAIASREQEES